MIPLRYYRISGRIAGPSYYQRQFAVCRSQLYYNCATGLQRSWQLEYRTPAVRHMSRL